MHGISDGRPSFTNYSRYLLWQVIYKHINRKCKAKDLAEYNNVANNVYSIGWSIAYMYNMCVDTIRRSRLSRMQQWWNVMKRTQE